MWMRLLDKSTFPVTLAPCAELDLSNLAQKSATPPPPSYAEHPDYPGKCVCAPAINHWNIWLLFTYLLICNIFRIAQNRSLQVPMYVLRSSRQMLPKWLSYGPSHCVVQSLYDVSEEHCPSIFAVNEHGSCGCFRIQSPWTCGQRVRPKTSYQNNYTIYVKSPALSLQFLIASPG
jgi:hypothetical protein